MEKTLDDWLREERSRAKSLADALDVTEAAISQWRRIGVPVERMPSIEAHTNGVVSIQAMVRSRVAAKEEARLDR